MTEQILQNKLSYILSLPLKDEQFSSALKELDAIHPDPAALSRTTARRSIEERSVAIAHSLLAAFRPLEASLLSLDAHLASMRAEASFLHARLQLTDAHAGDMLAEAHALAQRRRHAQRHHAASRHFLRRHTLSRAHLAALAAGPSPRFFAALRHLRRVKARALAALRCGDSRAELFAGVLETAAAAEQQAYERLYRWGKAECGQLALRMNCALQPDLPRALAALRRREVLLGYCLQDLAQGRAHLIGREFLRALAVGGPNGLPKPIEMHAHDPLRYLGEMLGWLHQTAASEYDLLLGLFEEWGASKKIQKNNNHNNNHNNGENDDENDDDDDEEDDDEEDDEFNDDEDDNDNQDLTIEKVQQSSSSSLSLSSQQSQSSISQSSISPQSQPSVIEPSKSPRARPAREPLPEPVLRAKIVPLLAKHFDSVCDIFISRVRPVLNAQTDCLVLLQLYNLFDFYERTLHSLLGPAALLANTLSEAKTVALTLFHRVLRRDFESIDANPEMPRAGLRLVPSLELMAHLLAQILQVFQGSLIPAPERERYFLPIAQALLEPLLRCVMVSASRLDSPLDVAVFLVNSLKRVEEPLAAYPFARQHREGILAKIDVHLASLVEESISRFVATLRIAPFVMAAQDRAAGAAADAALRAALPLSKMLGLDAASLAPALREFESVLFDLDACRIPGIDQLADALLRQQARRRLAAHLMEVYKLVHDAVEHPANQYADVASLLRYSPAQIEKISFSAASLQPKSTEATDQLQQPQPPPPQSPILNSKEQII